MKKYLTSIIFLCLNFTTNAQNELSFNAGMAMQSISRDRQTRINLPLIPASLALKYNHYLNNNVSAYIDAGHMIKGYQWDFYFFSPTAIPLFTEISTITTNIGLQYNFNVGRFVLSPNAGLFYSHFYKIGTIDINSTSNNNLTINTFSYYQLHQNEIGPLAGFNVDYKLGNHFKIGSMLRYSQGLNNISNKVGETAHSKNLQMLLALTYRF